MTYVEKIFLEFLNVTHKDIFIRSTLLEQVGPKRTEKPGFVGLKMALTNPGW